MKIMLLPVAVALMILSFSCNKAKDCRCAHDIDNEVVDSAQWLAAGQPFFFKSDVQTPQLKTYLCDTIVKKGECSSLNQYDSVGVDHPEEGLRTHYHVTCTEK